MVSIPRLLKKRWILILTIRVYLYLHDFETNPLMSIDDSEFAQLEINDSDVTLDVYVAWSTACTMSFVLSFSTD